MCAIHARFPLSSAPEGLSYARYTHSPAHSSIGMPSSASCDGTPTPCKYTVSGLFHSPLGVLFTFPSLYWFTIGHRTYLALPVSSGRFTRAIRVSSYSRIQTRVVIYFTYGAITLWGAASKQLRLYRQFVTLSR